MRDRDIARGASARQTDDYLGAIGVIDHARRYAEKIDRLIDWPGLTVFQRGLYAFIAAMEFRRGAGDLTVDEVAEALGWTAADLTDEFESTLHQVYEVGAGRDGVLRLRGGQKFEYGR